MKQQFKNYYVIQSSEGEILPQSVSYQRKSCIERFMQGSEMTWSEVKKNGWKCIKVNLIFEILL